MEKQCKVLSLMLIFGLFASALVPVSALAAGKGTGTLVVTTQDASKKQVSAQIYVDSALKGTGTVTLKKLPAKTYVVSFGDLTGYTIVSPRSKKKNVTVKAGKAMRVTATYKKSFSSTGITFTDNGNGAVSDSNGLMWQQGENPSLYNWYVASGTYDAAYASYNPSSTSVCGSLSLAGYSGWRLPTIDELKTLIDASRSSAPYINTTFFPNAYSSGYWSSTTNADYAGDAWYVGFNDGSVSFFYKTSSHYYVRCVR